MIIATIIMLGLPALYGLGFLVIRMSTAGLEYRAITDYIGKFAVFVGIPLWALLLMWYLSSKTWQKVLIGISMGIWFLWACICSFAILVGTDEDYNLAGKYIIVNTNTRFLGESKWETYEKRYVFFRSKCDYDPDMERIYLEKKYGEKFERVKMTGEMKEFCSPGHDMSYVWVSEKRPQIPALVTLDSYKLEDDYNGAVSDWYIYQAFQKGDLHFDLQYKYDINRWCFRLDKDGLSDFAKESSELIKEASKDQLFVKNRGTLYFYTEIEGEKYFGFLPFGKISQYDGNEYKEEPDYYLNSDLMQKAVEDKWGDVEKQAADHAEFVKEYRNMPYDESTETADEDSIASGETESTGAYPQEDGADDIYAAGGRKIWESQLRDKNIGDSFKTCYDARGNSYCDLGHDETYEYMLVYDRDSENGKYMLFVLYQVPLASDGQEQASYTDSSSSIKNIYALEKDGDGIIASGKTGWDDTGSKEYREATGE